jgi:hypothetical protein
VRVYAEFCKSRLPKQPVPTNLSTYRNARGLMFVFSRFIESSQNVPTTAHSGRGSVQLVFRHLSALFIVGCIACSWEQEKSKLQAEEDSYGMRLINLSQQAVALKEKVKVREIFGNFIFCCPW